jgi:hypothetical protein
MKNNYCIDCSKKISFYAKRCTKCANVKSVKLRMKHRRTYNGKSNPAYKDGSWIRFYDVCKKCGKKVCAANRSGCCNHCKDKYGKANGMFGRKHSEKTKKYFSKIYSGKKNPRYIDGRSREPYTMKFSEKLKEEIRIRDNHICQYCGIEQTNYYRKLDIHHIDYNKINCQKDNLITICNECNLKANSNRDYWYAYFRYIIEEQK